MRMALQGVTGVCYLEVLDMQGRTVLQTGSSNLTTGLYNMEADSPGHSSVVLQQRKAHDPVNRPCTHPQCPVGDHDLEIRFLHRCLKLTFDMIF